MDKNMKFLSAFSLTFALLLLVSCSAEMPMDGNTVPTPSSKRHAFLPLKQIPQRLSSMWATLPCSTSGNTRSSGNPEPNDPDYTPGFDENVQMIYKIKPRQ